MGGRGPSIAQLLDRTPILKATRETPLDRSTLEARFDISRATAYRQTAALIDQGLLESTPEGYQPTGPGAALAAAADRFERSVEAINHLEPLLETVAAPDLSKHIHLFADGEIAVAEPTNPSRPVDHWLEHFADCERVRGLVTIGGITGPTKRGVKHAHAGTDIDVVYTPVALQAHANATTEAFETILAAGNVTISTHPDLEFSLGIFDDTVMIAGCDPATALPVVTVATDRDDAQAWADGLFLQYRRESEPVRSLEEISNVRS